MRGPTEAIENTESSSGFTDRVRLALAKVVQSEAFAASPRLQQFLTFIVEEALSGHGDRIRGKAIAVEVYGRRLDGDDGASGLNLVRVEARRLRRLLAEYYEGEGAEEDIRIQVPAGGYRPKLTEGHAPPPQPETTPSEIAVEDAPGARKWRGVGVAVVLLLVAAVAGVSFLSRPAGTPSDGFGPTVETAARDLPVPRLQAVNLTDQARGMLFPAFELKRQALALQLFRHAIELDPTYSGGYAGAAQTLATLAILTPDPGVREERLSQAEAYATRAMETARADGWANASSAWVQAAAGNRDAAMGLARTAIDLSPADGHVLDVVGMVSLVSGAPELAAEVSDPKRERTGEGRFGARNIWGVSQYVLGNYRESVDAFSGAAAAGDPVSPPSLVFQAAAHDKLGETEEARRLVVELRETWPDFPAQFLISQTLASNPDVGDDILEVLSRHGFRAEPSPLGGN
ncbi:hypothetical protein CLV78_1011006 [Aliiruegeria haliotis]|uniref:Tetratricopeptide repeat protein n=1 Tax=Aliiruegeria haliotis TaxID=1280846 RepID=A0A2T0S0E4_9RHOB|nr:hypothetical protein [Aliiruegeria haliotis]PRY26901.1 hypothetical protein CLV78_1011006 [Aliiruegeria haliotis]